jgi:hypothetical protein
MHYNLLKQYQNIVTVYSPRAATRHTPDLTDGLFGVDIRHNCVRRVI